MPGKRPAINQNPRNHEVKQEAVSFHITALHFEYPNRFNYRILIAQI